MRTMRAMCGAAIVALTLAAPAAALQTLPPSGEQATDRLAASSRHAEWVTIQAGEDSVRAWVVYPEQRENARVVVAVHNNRGMSNWIRAVADQLAADGFIAIAPDMLSTLPVPRRPDGESDPDSVRAMIGQVEQATRDRYMQAFGEWGTRLPGASQQYGIVGFCWGGSNATVPPAKAALDAAGRTFETHMFAGAGHGFTHSQEARDGANRAAVEQAWPLTVAWFRRHLGGAAIEARQP